MSSKTLIGPFRQVITLRNLSKKGSLSDDQLEIIKEGAVLVENGRILRVGKFNELISFSDQIEEIEGDQLAMPGLVDCHTHMVWGGSRAADYALRMRGETYEKILETGGGIFDSVTKTRAANKVILLESLLSRLGRQIANGVTTLEIKSGYGLDKESELKMLEVVQDARSKTSIEIISTCLAAHVCPKEFSDKTAYLNYVLEEILPVIKERKLASRVDAFVEPSAFPVDISRPYLQKAKAMGFDLTVHADQFTTGGSQLAVELGAQSADHLEASTQKEIALLANSNVVAVALPGASLGLGIGFTPARKLLDAGAGLAISTDWNPGSGPMGDIITQAALLGIYEKLSTAEVFAGITFRAANALGLTDRGVLAEGMAADFISFPTSDYREILYQQGMLKPVRVWKKGEKI
jgi:imidazolonepropionase